MQTGPDGESWTGALIRPRPNRGGNVAVKSVVTLDKSS